MVIISGDRQILIHNTGYQLFGPICLSLSNTHWMEILNAYASSLLWIFEKN